MVPTLRHVLVIGVDGVRFDLLGPEVTPVIWGFTPNGACPRCWRSAAGRRWPGPGAVDVAGHVLGAGSAYREAARAADRRVGRLLGAVRSRPSVADEAWTTVVVTDHGHLGPGGPAPVTRQDQVAPLVLAALGDMSAA
jgi:hypothetical protein